MTRISLQFSALLATLFLFAFSCQDHVVPEPENALKINTLMIESPFLGEYNIGKYRVEIEALGNKPIKEYGIVSSLHYTNNDEYTETPTIENQISVIEEKVSIGERIRIDMVPNQYEITEMFYRAYAELENGEKLFTVMC